MFQDPRSIHVHVSSKNKIFWPWRVSRTRQRAGRPSMEILKTQIFKFSTQKPGPGRPGSEKPGPLPSPGED